MRVQLAGVGKHYGAQCILDHVTPTFGPWARVGLVGPNGIGKSTLLRIMAGIEQPDQGVDERAPERLTIGHLEQDRRHAPGESLLEVLARRTGVRDAELELEASAAAIAAGSGPRIATRAAVERLLSLGGGDFEARARSACPEVGLRVGLDRELEELSGGERARIELAAILLLCFDVLLLDEPTNHLDLEATEQLEAALARYQGTLVVSHDRLFLESLAPTREIRLGS